MVPVPFHESNWAKACARALAEDAAGATATQVCRGVWTIPSRSQEGTVYTVFLVPAQGFGGQHSVELSCTCQHGQIVHSARERERDAALAGIATVQDVRAPSYCWHSALAVLAQEDLEAQERQQRQSLMERVFTPQQKESH